MIERPASIRSLPVKRCFDVVVALGALLFLAPLMLLVALAVRICLGSPVLFRQPRPGRDGVIFELVKFRTMRDVVDVTGAPLADAERLTPFGRWLRASSLDELPELWNVVRGEMSLVGPRPLLVEYLPRYDERQRRRHELRPGITGWAQVNGRNATDWATRLEQDVWYVEHQSFALDLVILWRTVARVASAEGVSEPGQATMTRFVGEGGGS